MTLNIRLEPKPSAGRRPSRGTFLAGAAATTAALLSVRVNVGAQNLKKIVIAEPVHQIGYLPLYMAIDMGLFAKRGLDVSTLTASGGAHVSALVSGGVWGNIGGPESDAMANGNGNGNANPLISICNVVNRANNYMIAKKGTAPKSLSNADVAAFMKGKKLALNRFGGTPDVLGRWYIEKVGLNLTSDVTIINNADSSATPIMVKHPRRCGDQGHARPHVRRQHLEQRRRHHREGLRPRYVNRCQERRVQQSRQLCGRRRYGVR
jgi:ABC-type nitrate/sulfonate/bicarbonate transport system substrate-binding protein